MSIQGELNGNSCLSANEIEQIREYHKQGMKQNELAKMFGVSKSNISRVVNTKNWKHQ